MKINYSIAFEDPCFAAIKHCYKLHWSFWAFAYAQLSESISIGLIFGTLTRPKTCLTFQQNVKLSVCECDCPGLLGERLSLPACVCLLYFSGNGGGDPQLGEQENLGPVLLTNYEKSHCIQSVASFACLNQSIFIYKAHFNNRGWPKYFTTLKTNESQTQILQ